jgi:hypothetical protein
MNHRNRPGIWAVAVALAAVLAAAGAPPAGAARTEAALFYEELAPYGSWTDYGSYGPVWHPTKVSDNWRPYLDGRWVPSSEGWVFETSEPWGWATYHFGNWMPTQELGWVWVPGSTWYPATAAWRVGDDFVGWAPIPPPDFVPPPAFAPAGGFIPGTPVLELLTPRFWIFAHAPKFLLGFGQPFVPAFSFSNCGCLAPVNLVPGFFPRTVLLNNFFFPRFAPKAFFAFGPPFSTVAVFSNIELFRINNFAQSVDLLALQNVLPPAAIFTSRPFLGNVIPEPVLKGQRFQVRPVEDLRLAERNLARPGVIPPPLNVPTIRAEIPRMVITSRERPVPEIIKGTRIVRGTEIPPQAELEKRVLRPTFRRPLRAAPAPGLAAPVPGPPAERGRLVLEGRRGRQWPLTPQEENLQRQLEVELLREQVLRSRGFHRGREGFREREFQERQLQSPLPGFGLPQPRPTPPAGRGTYIIR